MTEQPAGNAVRRAREAAGVSLRSLARSVGISPASMSAIERGRTPLTVERLQVIAAVLNVPAARLLRGEPPRPSAQAASTPGSGPTEAWRRYEDPGLGRVLTAAVRLFVRQGFHATSVREVAAEAGLSVAGVYHHHPSKEALLVELMDRTMAEIRWRLLAARDSGADPKESFCLMVESLALFHAVRRDLAFLGASEMRGLSGADLARVADLRSEIQHLLDEQAALAFPGVDVRTACRAIATMCTALPSWFRPDGPLAPEQVAREYAVLAERMCSAG